jgi:hypothetical protein
MGKERSVRKVMQAGRIVRHDIVRAGQVIFETDEAVESLQESLLPKEGGGRGRGGHRAAP